MSVAGLLREAFCFSRAPNVGCRSAERSILLLSRADWRMSTFLEKHFASLARSHLSSTLPLPPDLPDCSVFFVHGWHKDVMMDVFCLIRFKGHWPMISSAGGYCRVGKRQKWKLLLSRWKTLGQQTQMRQMLRRKCRRGQCWQAQTLWRQTLKRQTLRRQTLADDKR